MFSVYDKHKEFTLNGTKNNPYPYSKSKELIKGRKCYEFYWKGGSCSFLTGFKRDDTVLFFFCNFHKPTLRFDLGSEIKEYRFEGKDVEAGINYMICIDTFAKKIFLINETATNAIEYNSSPSDFYVYLEQGSRMQKDIVTGVFDKNEFKHKIPPSFLPVTDRRLYDYPSCKPKAYSTYLISNIMLIFVLIS